MNPFVDTNNKELTTKAGDATRPDLDICSNSSRNSKNDEQ